MNGVAAIVVVIPARNEERLIGRCLESVAAAMENTRDHFGLLPVSVTVVADGCDDSTAEIAEAFDFVSVVTSPPIGVGAARRLGIDRALASLRVPPAQVWIANTDADSAVDANWLFNQLLAAGAGADLRVGAVRPDFDDLTDAQVSAWRNSHAGGAARGHVHGANLGIRASTYLDAAGFHPLFVHEDVDLVARSRQRGAVVATDEHPDVVTSGRSQGRAPGGYASYLNRELLLFGGGFGNQP